MAIGIGEPAPDFTLPGVNTSTDERRPYSLAEFRGQPVVLAFYPGDGTPVCTRQMSSYATDIERFREVDAQVVGISPQSVDSHVEFSCGNGGFAFPLLADEDKAAGEAYGILGPLGFYRRSVFVLDGDGIVRYAHRAVAGLTYRHTDEIVDAVKAAVAS
jgi:thioredoxin-dependent peroxiredoxin